MVTHVTRPWQESAMTSPAGPLLPPLPATAEGPRSECLVGGPPRSGSEAPVIRRTRLKIGHLLHLLPLLALQL